MQTESPFRIALLIVILLTTSIAVYFRRKASSSGEKITYEREGWIYALSSLNNSPYAEFAFGDKRQRTVECHAPLLGHQIDEQYDGQHCKYRVKCGPR